MKKLFPEEYAASMAHYALLLAVIAVACVCAMDALRGQIVAVFTGGAPD